MITLHVNGLALTSYDDGYAVVSVREVTGHVSSFEVFRHDALHLRIEKHSGIYGEENIVLESHRFSDDVESVVFCSPSGKPLYSYHK